MNFAPRAVAALIVLATSVSRYCSNGTYLLCVPSSTSSSLTLPIREPMLATCMPYSDWMSLSSAQLLVAEIDDVLDCSAPVTSTNRGE